MEEVAASHFPGEREGSHFQFSNRNKQGICLDMDHPKAEIFQRLVRESDVFLTNLRKTQNKTGYRLQDPAGINPISFMRAFQDLARRAIKQYGSF
jgi:crotonobetainyl-CoA:carnitine CoA-transferase CaiB-like acyl-CoA transferase